MILHFIPQGVYFQKRLFVLHNGVILGPTGNAVVYETISIYNGFMHLPKAMQIIMKEVRYEADKEESSTVEY